MDSKNLVTKLSMVTGEAPEVIAAKMDTMVATLTELCRGLDSVAIPGFGTFQPEKVDESVVETPAGRTLMPPAVTVQFKSSVVLRKALGK